MITRPVDDIFLFFLNSLQLQKRNFDAVMDYYGDGTCLLKPNSNYDYYIPYVLIKNVDEFRDTLEEYYYALCNFYEDINLCGYHSLKYFFARFFIDLAASDADDLNRYFRRKIDDLKENKLSSFDDTICSIDGFDFCAKNCVSDVGFESSHHMEFSLKFGDETFNLPLIRYTISDNKCYIHAIQMGMERINESNSYSNLFTSFIKKSNIGINEHRGVAPGFVVSLTLFSLMLKSCGIDDILVMDYGCGRYRNYYGNETEVGSDAVLSRMISNNANLLRRMDLEVDGFDLYSLAGVDGDSFSHIKLHDFSSKNEFINSIISNTKITLNEKVKSN